jgi:voltage-gated potassium channel
VPGRLLASLLMIPGYGIIAVPTGIVSAELVRAGSQPVARIWTECGAEIHDTDARHCKFCGSRLEDLPLRQQ